MRLALVLVVSVLLAAGPALAGSGMRQSPALMRKAGAACAPGRNRGPQRGAGYFYRLGGCAPADR